MLLINEQMTVVRANETIRHISGKDYHEIIGKDPARLSVACTAPAAPDCRRGTKAEEECSLRTMIQVSLESDKPIREPGDPAGFE